MIMLKQAVILAGGIGARLRPLTDKTPKPMILVNNRPFLEYLIELLKERGITEVILLLGYLPEKIVNHFGDGSNLGIKIKYSIGEVTFETGKRIKNAEKRLDKHFLLMYCDNYVPIKLKELAEFHAKQKTLATVTVYTNKDGIRKNNIYVDKDGFVVRYDRSRKNPNLNGVEIGFFIIDKKIVNKMPNDNFSFEDIIIPKLIEQRQLSGFKVDHRYYSIGSIERIHLTEQFLKPKKVIFLDRDGVINKKPPKAEYVKSWNEFEFLPGAIEALGLLTQNGYQTFILTNQAGIARGAMSESDLNDIHEHMKQILEKYNAKINGIYYCPHGWNEECECRKPKPGMFFQAAREHNLDLSKTIFIGDDERDLQAGNAAGCKTILVNSEKNLLDIVKSILKLNNNKRNVNYETLFNSILEKYTKSCKSRYLVLIGGCSQSGKTVLAQKIKENLIKKGIQCNIISLDNWIIGLNKRKGDETVRERFQYKKISEAINKLKQGKKIYPPVYDSKSRLIVSEKSSTPLYIEEHGIGIVDGVVALDIKDLRDISDFSVFVDINDEIRKKRLMEFYVNYKKYTAEEAKRIIVPREVDEIVIIKKTKDYADVIYDPEAYTSDEKSNKNI